jgi:chorismate synthase
MKIERDAADVTAGVRHGRTLGGYRSFKRQVL